MGHGAAGVALGGGGEERDSTRDLLGRRERQLRLSGHAGMIVLVREFGVTIVNRVKEKTVDSGMRDELAGQWRLYIASRYRPAAHPFRCTILY